MAKPKKTSQFSQPYPRILDPESRFYGMLDESQLVSHTIKIDSERLEDLIKTAISNANKKSSREILNISPNASPEEIDKVYKREGVELFKYFKKYCSDPASTAHEVYGKHYTKVAKEQFRNRMLQKQRMNSGWRYQYLARDCARESRRFTVSDIGTSESDFNAVIDFIDPQQGCLNIFVSVKNRSNTMGGQDWPKAIAALERVASNDKNKIGLYCCVFGITMERGYRYIKIEKKTNKPYSENTEVWLSDFFWPFFTNFSYEEIMTAVLNVLLSETPQKEPGVFNMEEIQVADSEEIEIPDLLLESFGEACKEKDLLDSSGCFNDPRKLVSFFCAPNKKIS